MTHWAYDAVFYHIYPLGMFGAPARNDFQSPAAYRLNQLYGWLDHLGDLGVNALYIGPLFESSTHGYDTVDYYHVDRRLGNNDTLKHLVAECHARGIRMILDGVFNHVGRDFWAFYDVRERGPDSPYRDWFAGLNFEGRSPKGDPFIYESWQGHYSLVKLNLENPAVREHLLGAVEMWINEFDIDGLRLDAADDVDIAFWHELSAFSRARRPDFWLVGEVIHGDYRHWANPHTFDAVTNYECYKGLYSSHVDRNYFEIAYAFDRQFGPQGMYRGLPLYAFADNHDVHRVASNVTTAAHLYPLYALLFTMPGVPSIYYGSEWGLRGRKAKHSDAPLRPALDPDTVRTTAPQPDLVKAIQQLAAVRHRVPALRYGDYVQVHVDHEQFAFARWTDDEQVIVAVNAAAEPVELTLNVPFHEAHTLVDVLNPGDTFAVREGRVQIDPLHACWARVLRAV